MGSQTRNQKPHRGNPLFLVGWMLNQSNKVYMGEKQRALHRLFNLSWKNYLYRHTCPGTKRGAHHSMKISWAFGKILLLLKRVRKKSLKSYCLKKSPTIRLFGRGIHPLARDQEARAAILFWIFILKLIRYPQVTIVTHPRVLFGYWWADLMDKKFNSLTGVTKSESARCCDTWDCVVSLSALDANKSTKSYLCNA